jgi:hypothetical protein
MDGIYNEMVTFVLSLERMVTVIAIVGLWFVSIVTICKGIVLMYLDLISEKRFRMLFVVMNGGGVIFTSLVSLWLLTLLYFMV